MVVCDDVTPTAACMVPVSVPSPAAAAAAANEVGNGNEVGVGSADRWLVPIPPVFGFLLRLGVRVAVGWVLLGVAGVDADGDWVELADRLGDRDFDDDRLGVMDEDGEGLGTLDLDAEVLGFGEVDDDAPPPIANASMSRERSVALFPISLCHPAGDEADGSLVVCTITGLASAWDASSSVAIIAYAIGFHIR